MKSNIVWKFLLLLLGILAFTTNGRAQTVTNPCPNRVISWNLDDWSTINPNDLAGLAPATNWVDTYLNNITTSLPDNTKTATTMNLNRRSYNTYHVQGNHPGLDANGTANRELLNGFLNAGPAAWNPNPTNTWVALTNIPYAQYDVIVYFNSDTSGRHASIDNGSTTYYFSTVGSPSRSGANALFLPTTETNSTKFPSADFAFFPGMTSSNAVLTELPLSGNDQWLGIAAVQVIQSSNTYIAYGPSPASQIVPVGQSASFSVMAGGLTAQYQWRHAGTNIMNATNATYIIGATSVGQDGNYDVIVSNSFSSVTSVVATLTFYTPKTVEWNGSGSTWDTSSLFWTANGGTSTTNYTETDNVLFDPLGAAQSTVTLSSTFTPSSITVSNAAYTVTSGSLSGSGSLRIRNNGTLILDTVDTRTGPTVIDNGSELQLDNGDTAGSLGSGAMTNNGALVFNANGDEAYGYPVYGTGNITNLSSAGTITLGNNLNGNYLAQAGGGVLLLQGSNSFTGGFTVSSGTVWARAANCLSMAPVTVAGGELQLIFGIDFAGTNVTLAGGLLHGGINGSQILEGQLNLSVDSSVQVDGANSLTLANTAGVNGNGFNLTKTGSGTLILNGNSNSLAGLVLASGAVAINSAANQTLTNVISGPADLRQTGSGTTTLTGDNSGMFGFTYVTAGKLLMNTSSGAAGVIVTNTGSFGGNGIISGPVVVYPGATLAPGSTNIDTLTLNNWLSIGGNVAVKVNKSLSQSNDFVSVASTLSNTNNGTLTVNNLGPALAVGDKFTIFNQPVTGGDMLTVSGGGVVWSNNLVNDGSILVLSTTVSKPVIRNISITGGNVIISGTNASTGTFYLLSSTNIAAPLANWTRVSTNSFDGSGNFNITNAVGGAPQNFYMLQLP